MQGLKRTIKTLYRYKFNILKYCSFIFFPLLCWCHLKLLKPQMLRLLSHGKFKTRNLFRIDSVKKHIRVELKKSRSHASTAFKWENRGLNLFIVNMWGLMPEQRNLKRCSRHLKIPPQLPWPTFPTAD